MKALNSRKIQIQFFIEGSIMQRIDIKILKMRIFSLGQGTRRIQSALLLAQLRQKITVEITNSLLLLFNADIEDSYNCVKTTSIQQKTIVSIQAWAELCISSIRRILPGTYQVAAKVLMMGPTLRNKRLYEQAGLSCAMFPY